MDVDFHGSHHCNLHSILHYFSLWNSVYSKRHSQFLLFQLQHDRESNDPFWEAQKVKKNGKANQRRHAHERQDEVWAELVT
ncbi:unnamed protein product [Brassica rapa subsp. trilocularis]